MSLAQRTPQLRQHKHCVVSIDPSYTCEIYEHLRQSGSEDRADDGSLSLGHVQLPHDWKEECCNDSIGDYIQNNDHIVEIASSSAFALSKDPWAREAALESNSEYGEDRPDDRQRVNNVALLLRALLVVQFRDQDNN
jgi:hypothetical protein